MKSTVTTELNLAWISPAELVLSPYPSNLIAGTYALIGARLFNPSLQSKRVSMIVDMGNDFPSSTRAALDHLKSSILFRSTPERRTSRGYNLYGPGELRSISCPETKLMHKRLSIFDTETKAWCRRFIPAIIGVKNISLDLQSHSCDIDGKQYPLAAAGTWNHVKAFFSLGTCSRGMFPRRLARLHSSNASCRCHKSQREWGSRIPWTNNRWRATFSSISTPTWSTRPGLYISTSRAWSAGISVWEIWVSGCNEIKERVVAGISQHVSESCGSYGRRKCVLWRILCWVDSI